MGGAEVPLRAVNWRSIEPSHWPPFLRAMLLVRPSLAGTAGRTGDTESCSCSRPTGLRCFRAALCSPLPYVPHFVSAAARRDSNALDAAVAPSSPCQHWVWGHTSSSSTGLGLLEAQLGNAWAKKPVSSHQLSPFPVPAPEVLLGASCCKGASRWRGLFFGAGLGWDDGCHKQLQWKLILAAYLKGYLGLQGFICVALVFVAGSGCLRHYAHGKAHGTA